MSTNQNQQMMTLDIYLIGHIMICTILNLETSFSWSIIFQCNFIWATDIESSKKTAFKNNVMNIKGGCEVEIQIKFFPNCKYNSNVR